MDWIDTLVWLLRGRGWTTLSLCGFVAAVYAFVPLQTEGSTVLTLVDAGRFSAR